MRGGEDLKKGGRIRKAWKKNQNKEKDELEKELKKGRGRIRKGKRKNQKREEEELEKR